MLFNKRHMLQGGMALAFAGPAGRFARADEAGTTLVVRQHALQLTPSGPTTTLLRYSDDAARLSVVRAKQGQDLALRIRNALQEPTSFRLCGLHGVGSLDDPGLVSGAAIAPGAETVVRFRAAESGMALFRPGLAPDGQAARGLSGVLIVDPTDAVGADQDLVCLLEDWPLDDKGQLVPDGDLPSQRPATITASKKPIPAEFVFAPGSRVRLRLVNGSIRRVMVVACEGVRPTVIAIDGQPSELFQPSRDTIPIGPGARFDYLLDLPRDAGQSVRLTLRGSERSDGILEPDRLIWTLKTAGDPLSARAPIGALPPNPALPARIPLETAKRADLTFDMTGGAWTVNGVNGSVLPKLPVLRVKQTAIVTLGLVNGSKSLVSLTLYGQAMRLLHPLDDGWEPYWRDTLLLPPGSRNHVAFVAAEPGRWLIESGFQDQAAGGLRCWFDVTRR